MASALTNVLGRTGVSAVGRLTGILVAAIAVQLNIDWTAQFIRR